MFKNSGIPLPVLFYLFCGIFRVIGNWYNDTDDNRRLDEFHRVGRPVVCDGIPPSISDDPNDEHVYRLPNSETVLVFPLDFSVYTVLEWFCQSGKLF